MMPQCEECPREVDEGQKLCRYHSAKHQASRADWAESVKTWGGKALPLLLPIAGAVLGKFRKR